MSGFQTCPRCAGIGQIMIQPMPYSFMQMATGPIQCPVCNGKMIISVITGRPPIDIPVTKKLKK